MVYARFCPTDRKRLRSRVFDLLANQMEVGMLLVVVGHRHRRMESAALDLRCCLLVAVLGENEDVNRDYVVVVVGEQCC